MRMNFETKGESKTHYASWVVAVLLLASLLAGCTTPTPTPAAVPPTAVQPTTVPPTAVQPTAVPATAAPDPAYYANEPVAVVPTGVPGQPMVTAAANTSIRQRPRYKLCCIWSLFGWQRRDRSWDQPGQPMVCDQCTGRARRYGMGECGLCFSAGHVRPARTCFASRTLPRLHLYHRPGENPQATALTEVYVRTGPGEQYPAYGIALTGSTALVIGKSQDGAWWTIRLNPATVGAGYGWVSAAYVQASNVELSTGCCRASTT